jgi:hypothetical protein
MRVTGVHIMLIRAHSIPILEGRALVGRTTLAASQALPWVTMAKEVAKRTGQVVVGQGEEGRIERL